MHRVRVSTLAIFAIAYSIAYAQTSSLSGNVRDARNAPISGASVTVVNTATNASRTTTTAEDGTYSLTLDPGIYVLHVEKKGFLKAVRTDLSLTPNQTNQVDLTLQVENIAETVDVSAKAPLLNTADGSVSTTISREVLERVPLNGRSFNSLIQITPGVALTATNGNDLWGQFSANGQRASANYYTVDGVGANFSSTTSTGPYGSSGGQFASVDVAGGTMGMASIDAVEEFKVQTSSFAPEFGRQPGAQVQIRTRSGTNDFHGSLFEYFRNDVLDANDWFNDQRSQKKNPLRNNSFGGTFGGRLIKNKSFFFLSHESLRASVTSSGVIEVPTLEARALANPALRPYLNAFPIPNGKPLASLSAEFIAAWPNYIQSDSTSIRWDHRFNDKVTIFGRYLRAPSNQIVRDLGRIMSQGISDMNSKTVTVGATMNHSPGMTSDVRFNWSQSNADNRWPYAGFGGAVAPPPEFVPATPRGFGVFSFGSSWYNGGKFFTDNVQRQINAVGSFAWHHDAHQFKFGADYRRLSPTSRGFDLYVVGQFPSNNLEALQTGISPYGIYVSGGITRETRSHNLSAYAQDVWRVKDNLTLTYGIRWEFNPPQTNRDDKPVLALLSGKSPAEMLPAPPGTAYYKTTYTSFGPRVGIAWSLGDQRKTVLRAAFGVFHDLTAGGTGVGFLAWNPPYTQSYTLNNVPYPSADPRLHTLIPPPPDYPYSAIWTADPDLKAPYSLQWNTSVEHEFRGSQAVTVSYVAAEGRRQLIQDSFRNPNKYFANLYVTRNGGESSYHSLQLQYRKTWNRRFQAIANYSLGHSIDTQSQDTGFGFPSDRDLIDIGSRKGNSSFDIRQSFNFTSSYQIPSAGSGWLRAITNGWGINALFRARTGSPIDITAYRDIGRGYNSFRADYVGGPVYIDDPNVGGGRRLNPAAFVIPAQLRQGNLGRNAIYGFGMWQPDLSLSRRFVITDKVGLDLRIESFNFVNHPNFGNPNTAVGAPNFGISQTMFATAAGGVYNGGLFSGTGQSGTNPIFQVGGPRSTQIALKLTF